MVFRPRCCAKRVQSGSSGYSGLSQARARSTSPCIVVSWVQSMNRPLRPLPVGCGDGEYRNRAPAHRRCGAVSAELDRHHGHRGLKSYAQDQA
jgi:hypothetical protein